MVSSKKNSHFLGMGKESPPSEIEIKVHPRRGNSTNHLLESNPTAPSPPSNQPPDRADLRRVRRRTPWLMTAFVATSFVVFVVTMFVNDCPKISNSCFAAFLGRFSFQPLKENFLLGPSSPTLDKMGALDVTKVVYGHQGWRLITCIWLHAGVIHLFANMLSLLFIGIRLEQEFGFVKIGMLYLISGFGGSLLSSLFIQSSLSVGASGSLFGLLGGMLSELITNWSIYANKFSALSALVFIIVINLAFGLLPHVDNFAHIGGFMSGFLLGFVFLIRPQFGWSGRKNGASGYHAGSVKQKHKMYQYILWIAAALFLIAGFTVGLIMLFRGVDANDHCPWCRYLSCLPTSKWKCNSSDKSCLASWDGDQLTFVCQDGHSNKTHHYLLPNATDAQIRDLCIQFCS